MILSRQSSLAGISQLDLAKPHLPTGSKPEQALERAPSLSLLVMPPRAPPPPLALPPGISQQALGLGSIFAWSFFSSAIIFLNKELYVMGFDKPFFVTGAGQAFSAAGGLLLAFSARMPLRVPSPRSVMLPRQKRGLMSPSCRLYRA
jgi:hypothetical protein